MTSPETDIDALIKQIKKEFLHECRQITVLSILLLR